MSDPSTPEPHAPPRGLFLIGFSGTGKSAVAALVGARLGWPVHDLDRLVAERADLTVPEIFQREGEPGFRRREAEALREVSAAGHFVVATGGGAPVSPENRALMGERGWRVTLEARPETILARIQRQLGRGAPDAVRPLLDAPDPLEKIRALKVARQPIYALADWTVHTDRLSLGQVADEIVRARGLLDRAARR
jgi:shikimate kinase